MREKEKKQKKVKKKEKKTKKEKKSKKEEVKDDNTLDENSQHGDSSSKEEKKSKKEVIDDNITEEVDVKSGIVDSNDDEDVSKVEKLTENTTSNEEEKKTKRKRKRKRKKQTADDDDEEDKDAPERVVEKILAEVDRTVYVEGLPFTATPDDVKGWLTSHGMENIQDLRLPTWHDSGRLKGYGHVVVPDEDAVQAALALSGTNFTNSNRYVTIVRAKKPKTEQQQLSEPSATIILRNLSYNATEEDIQDVMKTFGEIDTGCVRVVRDSSTSQSKGFAYVTYTTTDAATKAVEQANSASGIVICHRQCRLDYDHGRIRGSFRTVDRQLWHKQHK